MVSFLIVRKKDGIRFITIKLIGKGATQKVLCGIKLLPEKSKEITISLSWFKLEAAHLFRKQEMLKRLEETSPSLLI